MEHALEQTLTIPGVLPDLNELIDAAKTRTKHAVSVGRKRMRLPLYGIVKKKAQAVVERAIEAAQLTSYTGAVNLTFSYFLPNRRIDPDNVTGAAHKIVLDALVNCGILRDDGWRYILPPLIDMGWEVDDNEPRVVVVIRGNRKRE